MKRRTLEEAKYIFSLANLELLSTVYKSVDTPMKCKNTDGYLFNRSLRTVEDALDKTQAYSKPFSIKNTYFWENIIYYMDNYVTTNTVLLSKKQDYLSGNSKLVFLCGSCGKTYKTTWANFVHADNKVCATCYRKIRYEADYTENRRTPMFVYYDKAKEMGLTLLSNNIRSTKEKVEVQDEEGYKGIITASRLLQGSTFEKFSVRNPYSLYNIRLLMEKRNNGCYIYDQEFKGTGYYLKARCACGADFTVDASHLIYEHKDKCNACRIKQSKIAQAVEDWLKLNKITYTKEKIFDGCRGKKGKLLQFDFYVSDKNICIEVDGLQHFKPVTWFGATKEEAEENFNILKSNDSVKNQFCLQNGIILIRLPFWQIEHSEEYKTILGQFFPSKSSELG